MIMKTNICLFIFLCFCSLTFSSEYKTSLPFETEKRPGTPKITYNDYGYNGTALKGIHSEAANGNDCNSQSFKDNEYTGVDRTSGVGKAVVDIIGDGSQHNGSAFLNFDQ